MVNSQLVVLVALACSLVACDRGSAKSGPTCDQAATNIVAVQTKGEKSVHAMEAKGAVAKTCTESKWSDDARACITKATTSKELKMCAKDKLTGEQGDRLKAASVGLGAGGFEEAMAKMGELKDKMCKCTDAKCAQAVSDELTKWGQEEAAQHEDEKPTEEQMKQAQQIGEAMANCMMKAMGGDTPPLEEQGNPNTDGPPAGSGAVLHTNDVVK
jgi:hypothetical protein